MSEAWTDGLRVEKERGIPDQKHSQEVELTALASRLDKEVDGKRRTKG